jgi:hypothetical protein
MTAERLSAAGLLELRLEDGGAPGGGRRFLGQEQAGEEEDDNLNLGPDELDADAEDGGWAEEWGAAHSVLTLCLLARECGVSDAEAARARCMPSTTNIRRSLSAHPPPSPHPNEDSSRVSLHRPARVPAYPRHAGRDRWTRSRLRSRTNSGWRPPGWRRAPRTLAPWWDWGRATTVLPCHRAATAARHHTTTPRTVSTY